MDKATKFIPTWVKVAVALALGMGTMVGWKRIVVTVGEKIGKEHLTYAQGATAGLVAMGTIFAADNSACRSVPPTCSVPAWPAPWPPTGAACSISTIRNIAAGWVFTLPAAALLSGLLFWLFRPVLRLRSPSGTFPAVSPEPGCQKSAPGASTAAVYWLMVRKVGPLKILPQIQPARTITVASFCTKCGAATFPRQSSLLILWRSGSVCPTNLLRTHLPRPPKSGSSAVKIILIIVAIVVGWAFSVLGVAEYTVWRDLAAIHMSGNGPGR